MLSPAQTKNLSSAAAAAVQAEQQTGCPADLTIVQWALESGWGEHTPAHSNNPFGIKARPGEQYVESQTEEVVKGERVKLIQRFRIFATLADAFIEHGNLITTGTPYAEAWEQCETDENLVNLIKGVALHYSTTPPSIYSGKLLEILIMKPVQDALTEARRQAIAV